MPDREMDAKIQALLYPWDELRCRICGWPLDADVRGRCRAGDCSLRPAPTRRADEPANFSADLNLALAAYEELWRRTGWRLDMIVHNLDGNGYRAGLRKQMTWLKGEAATPAEALCRVILEAATHAS